MYKDYADHDFKWLNYTPEELANAHFPSQISEEIDASTLKKEFPVKEPLV